MQVTYKTEKQSKKRVYYTGSDALVNGYVLCYDRDADPSSDSNITSVYQRYAHVEKPSATNLGHVAGVLCSGSFTGPGWCDILEFRPGSVQDVYCDVNCIYLESPLAVQAGSYYLGNAGEGPIVGMAIQTINRSSTAGLVQMITSPSPFPGALGGWFQTAAESLSDFWNDCPLLANGPFPLNGNVNCGSESFFGFWRGPDLNAWEKFATDADCRLTGITDVLNASSLTTGAGDNDEITLQYAAAVAKFVKDSGKKVWFEARIACKTITDEVGFFVGLAAETQALASFMDDNTMLLIADDHIGFAVDTDGDDIHSCHNDSGGTEVIVEADFQVPVAETFYNLGFKFDGAETVTFYADGTASATTADLDDTDFPLTNGMCPTVAAKTGAAAARAYYIQWIACAYY